MKKPLSFRVEEQGEQVLIYQTLAGQNTNPRIYDGWTAKALMWMINTFFLRLDKSSQ